MKLKINKRRRYTVAVIILSFSLISLFLLNVSDEIFNEKSNLVLQAYDGLIVEASALEAQKKQPDYYTTVFVNKLRNVINKEQVDINFKAFNNIDIKSITVLSNAVEGSVAFDSKSKEEAKNYIHSLQDPNKSYMVKAINDPTYKYTEEDYLFYTSKALLIAEYLDFKLLNQEDLMNELNSYSKKFDSLSPKEIISLIDIIGVDFTNTSIIEDKFSAWLNAEGGGMKWFLDLYYLSKIIEETGMSNEFVPNQLEADLGSMILNGGVDLTTNYLAIETLNNLGLLESKYLESAKDLSKKLDREYQISEGIYSLYSPIPGDLKATYYNYLYHSSTSNDEMIDIEKLKQGLINYGANNGFYKNSSPEELYELLYLYKEYGILEDQIIKNAKRESLNEMEQSKTISDIYYSLETLNLLGVSKSYLNDYKLHTKRTLQDKYPEIVSTLDTDLSSMYTLFQIISISNYFGLENEIVLEKNKILEKIKKANAVQNDLRVKYLYVRLSGLLGEEIDLTMDDLKEYKDGKMFYLSDRNNEPHIYTQYIGHVIETSLKNKEVNSPL